jgi:hypothetical protein
MSCSGSMRSTALNRAPRDGGSITTCNGAAFHGRHACTGACGDEPDSTGLAGHAQYGRRGPTKPGFFFEGVADQ